MELYMVCVLIVIAMAMLIFKGVQLVLSIFHPLPNVSELNWRRSPQLPVEPLDVVQTIPDSFYDKKKNRSDRHKRPPRNIRLEQLYGSNPYSFDELDSSYSRRSMYSSRSRPLSRGEEFPNMSPANEREHLQPGIPLEQLTFVEDEEDDPIHAYVSQQHQRMVAESYRDQHRSSTPIQSPNVAGAPPPSQQPRTYPKSHFTIV